MFLMIEILNLFGYCILYLVSFLIFLIFVMNPLQ